MSKEKPVAPEEIDILYGQLKEYAEAAGYYLNPDAEFARALAAGILTNQRRYGYWACPCRLASGREEEDRDIICPCDYRDADILEHGACYCGLYVSGEVFRGEKKLASIPEKRPPVENRQSKHSGTGKVNIGALPLPVWRCRVCGYLCARDDPPEKCPVCKVGKERFERFI